MFKKIFIAKYSDLGIPIVDFQIKNILVPNNDEIRNFYQCDDKGNYGKY
jgi:hypothetical protein